MLRRSRRRRERLLLPGESMGRRGFIARLLVGATLLAGVGWFAWRRPDDLTGVVGPFAVLSPSEAALLLAIARRTLPGSPRFPSPEAVRVPERVDSFLAMSHPGVQRDVKQLLSLFDSALLGLVLDRSPRRFRDMSAAGQDARLTAWSSCPLAFRRTGFRALRRLLASAYWSSPATWGAVGYPGPPDVGGR